MVGFAGGSQQLGHVVLDQQRAHDQLQGPFFTDTGQVNGRGIPAVPLADHRKHDDDYQRGLDQRQQNLEQDADGTRAVQLGRFLVGAGQLLKGGLHHNDVVCVHQRGHDDCPAGIDEAQAADDHVGGDQAAAEDHGEHDEHGERPGQLEILAAHQEAGDGRQEGACRGVGHNIQQGIAIALDDGGIAQHNTVSFQRRPAQRRKEDAGGSHQQPRITDGGHQDVPQGHQTQKAKDDQHAVIEDAEDDSGFACTLNHIDTSLKHRGIGVFLAEVIRRQQQYGVDYGVEQAYGGGIAVLRLFNTQTLDVGADDVGGGIDAGVIQQQDLLEAHTQQGAAAKDQHGHDRRHDAGNGDAPHAAQTVGAINGGCLVHLLADGGDRRHKDDGRIAQVLPQVGQQVDGPEVIGVRQQVFFGPPRERAKDIGHHAVGGAELNHQAADHHQGNEIGHVADGLDRLFEALAADFVQLKGEDDGHRVGNDQTQQADDQRVAQNRREAGIGEEVHEVVKAHPLAAQDTALRLEILERDH